MSTGLWMPTVVGAASKILPGLVHCTSWMKPETQQKISRLCLEKILPAGHDSTPLRKRFYGSITEFPDLEHLYKEALDIAGMQEPSFTDVKATHFICLQYLTQNTPQNYIPWHVDNGDNDGIGDLPVTSVSLGDACEFLIKAEKSSPTHSVRLDSGDAIVFGKESRMIWHSIKTIYPDTAPSFLPFKGSRINLTFRVTPHLRGREEEFKAIPKDLPKNNRFYKIMPGKD